ncbi:MAG: tyrosine recombinase XerC [Clostridia bacterium]|nr:tyrosine recombinase XerC [Clostridia bacterium]
MINIDDNPEFLNTFLEYSLAYKHKSPNSVDQYNSDLIMFLRYMKYHLKLTKEKEFSKIIIKDFSISQLSIITQEDIHSFISYLSINRRCGPATCARKISTIRIFFKYLTITTHVLSTNPAQNLETPKLNKRLPKYLTLEDSQKLLNATQADEDSKNSERDFAIITLFLNCGLRLSELVSINISDIKFDECKLTVIGKGNKERTIYLNKACIKAINNYLKIRPNNAKKDSKNSDKALFLSAYRQRISKRTVENIVTKKLQKAGLDTSKYSTHKLRHTAATLMYQYGQVDIRALQELLGHESIATTEIYTHVDNNQVRLAVESNPLSDFGTKK